jgi:uncharacterized membrane protein
MGLGAVFAILSSGLATLLFVGMKHDPLYWHLMPLLGINMCGNFVYVFIVPYQKLKAALAVQDWPAGGAALGRIRQLIGINFILGLVSIAVASLGRLI